jgi:DNA-directed RNA polymerase specialized sigma subunit
MTKTTTDFPAVLPLFTGDGKGLNRDEEQRLFGLLDTARRYAATQPHSVWPDRIKALQSYLVKANTRLCHHWANRSAGGDENLAEELFSVCLEKLLYCTTKFDATRKLRFSTYCCTAMKHALSLEAERRHTLRARVGRLVHDVADTRAAPSLMENEFERAKLEAAISNPALTEQERAAIRWAFLNVAGQQTLESTGKALGGVSKERARQVIQLGLLKLRLVLQNREAAAKNVTAEDVAEEKRAKKRAKSRRSSH